MKKIKILLIGKNGQIGSSIKKRLSKVNKNITCWSKKELNLENLLSIQKKLIDHPKFLTDGLEVDILIHAEKGDILNCELPLSIETKIIYTEPSVKGDTATNATKNAKIETGEEIQVPLFINKNDKIKVDTKQGKYIERVK